MIAIVNETGKLVEVKENTTFSGVYDVVGDSFAKYESSQLTFVSDDYQPDDNDLRGLLWECIYNGDPQYSVPSIRKHETAYMTHLRSVMSAVYGIEFDASLPRQFYEDMNDLWYNEDESGFVLYQYDTRNLLVHIHAYTLLWNNETLYNSDEFFRTVLSSNGVTAEDWENMGDKQYAAISNYKNSVYYKG